MLRSKLPALYPILDAAFLPVLDRELYLRRLAMALDAAGVTLLQYRNKQGRDRERLADAAVLRETLAAGKCTLIFNDRADLAVLAGFDGVHVGQDDLSPEGARRVVGNNRIVGVSTHNEVQLQAANASTADYIAVGPVFATVSKANPDPTLGLEGVRLGRQLTTRPIVAIGGITLANCKVVREAGADAVAVIAAVFGNASPAQAVTEFLLKLGENL